VVLAAGNVQECFTSFERAHLACIDALDRVIGVTELPLRCEAPGRGKVLLLLLVNLLLNLLRAMQIFLRHLVVLLLLHPINSLQSFFPLRLIL